MRAVPGYLRWDSAAIRSAALRADRTARAAGLGALGAAVRGTLATAAEMDGDLAEAERLRAEMGDQREEQVRALVLLSRLLGHTRRLEDDVTRPVLEEVAVLARSGSRRLLKGPWRGALMLQRAMVAPPGTAVEDLDPDLAIPEWSALDLVEADLARAVVLGRSGDADGACAYERAAAARFATFRPGTELQYHLARLEVARAALVDGWGEPVAWLTEGLPWLEAPGPSPASEAARALLRRAGAAVPRAHGDVEPALRARRVTAREREVLAALASGHTRGSLAEHLGASPRTVDKHLERLRAKLGSASTAELEARAQQLLDPGRPGTSAQVV